MLRWECKYHVVIFPKYRKKILYGKVKRGIGEILRDLCRQKGLQLEEGKAMPEHIHIKLFKCHLLSIEYFRLLNGLTAKLTVFFRPLSFREEG
ncbi:MAG TPA: IS200/IS605 family transposase [Desulfobacterales bacterium]|nr:IS200/IS605 family transposase [Desulfobacterales bacterium]